MPSPFAPAASMPEPMIYGLVMAALWTAHLAARRRRHRRSEAALRESEATGSTEPASLHPLVDPVRCLGCGACVRACPEGEVLGLIDGKAEMIRPTDCIGHGACREACPTDAITLVFGTARRGVDIPTVTPRFETNVPGVFIAGELGGMGLIRNAVEQGRRAMDSIAELCREDHGEPLDVVIVGAGPAGFSASLAAMQHELRALTLEQDTLGGTVARYPRGKVVMTAPADLPLVGKVKFREVSKEKLLEFWREVEKDTGVQINYREPVERVRGHGSHVEVRTPTGVYRARAALLAIGRRGTPRKLGVRGEELAKVAYSLGEPEQYRSKHVLVVGGGDSALEAAATLADRLDADVTLAYRGEGFGRAKARNRSRVEAAAAERRLTVLTRTDIRAIDADTVLLEVGGRPAELKNDAVILCTGGILPTGFLRDIGIDVETKHGTA